MRTFTSGHLESFERMMQAVPRQTFCHYDRRDLHQHPDTGKSKSQSHRYPAKKKTNSSNTCPLPV